MKRAIGFVLAIVVVLALVIIILPKVTTKETLSYKDAVQKYAKGKFVTVDGRKIHYIEKGDGKPVILIHGFLYSTAMWNKSIDAFASKFKTYAVDLWGWGYSERLNATDYSFPLYAQADSAIHGCFEHPQGFPGGTVNGGRDRRIPGGPPSREGGQTDSG